jgi:hypothetical protein
MNPSFNVVKENQFDRRFGGTSAGTADPYVSGYHFIYFKKLPPKLATNIGIVNSGSNAPNIGGVNQVQQLLSASCLSVTPPGGTLNKTDFTGLGGTKWSVPTNIDYGNTITIKFLEYSSLPIKNVFHGWVRMIRDYRTGVSVLEGNNYTKSQYASTLLYWTTKPDGKTVEYAACYTGVFPTKDPQDLFSGDIGTYDKLEIDMEFSLDWAWHENWVYAECQKWANSFHQQGVNVHGLGSRTGSNGPKEI